MSCYECIATFKHTTSQSQPRRTLGAAVFEPWNGRPSRPSALSMLSRLLLSSVDTAATGCSIQGELGHRDPAASGNLCGGQCRHLTLRRLLWLHTSRHGLGHADHSCYSCLQGTRTCNQEAEASLPLLPAFGADHGHWEIQIRLGKWPSGHAASPRRTATPVRPARRPALRLCEALGISD